MDAITRVYNGHPKTVLFASAAIVRVLLAVTFPGLPDLLTGRVEISTPVNSFKRRMWTRRAHCKSNGLARQMADYH